MPSPAPWQHLDHLQAQARERRAFGEPAAEHGSGSWRRRILTCTVAILGWGSLLGAVPAAGARSVVELQAARVEKTAQIRGDGTLQRARLIDLNPRVRRWYLLELTWRDGSSRVLHLEHQGTPATGLTLSPEDRGVRIGVDGDRTCPLWTSAGALRIPSDSGPPRPYVQLCDEPLFLRQVTTGRRTRREWATDLLRDRVRYGEQITNFVKEKLYRDKYRRESAVKANRRGEREWREGPARLRLVEDASRRILHPPDLNLVISREPGGGLVPGEWYPVTDHPGVFVSVTTPNLVSREILAPSEAARPLDPKEASALVYLVAFDLSRFELGFALGTDHPRVGWSDRVPESSRVSGWPGPDGFDTVAPLVRTGKLAPNLVSRAEATFAGGFKRTHGGFKYGELSRVRNGSHYGFVENGVVLSTLQPSLSTLVVYEDGEVELKTWTEADAAAVSRVRHARQNGVPLLETDPATGQRRLGALVREWGKGNWSGSQNELMRTLRAGVCLQRTTGQSFLIYGYFSSVTPATMGQVFQACDCEYAMHLDMNAPEHTYLALYRVEGTSFVVERLVEEMKEVDPPVDGQEVPRFLGYSDTRDFFYLLRKESQEP